MKQAYQDYQSARQDIAVHKAEEWRMALNFLRQTNRNLFLGISRRMLNFLSWSGIEEAEKILQKSPTGQKGRTAGDPEDNNRPYHVALSAFTEKLSDETFRLAARCT